METRLRTGLKVSRGIQLLGVVLAVVGIVDYTQRGTGFAFYLMLAIFCILGARVYEWMTKP